MNPLNLILRLCERFVKWETGEFDNLSNDAKAWWISIDLRDETLPVWKRKLKEWSEFWPVRMICAILFIYLVKSIQMWMESKPEEDTEEEDD